MEELVMQGELKDFNFRQLVGKTLFLVNDPTTLNLLRQAEYEYYPGDNAVLVYGFIHPRRGIMFQALAIAKLSVERDILFGNRLKYDIRTGNERVSTQLLHESIRGELIEFEADTLEYDCRKFIELADSINSEKVDGVIKMRNERTLDPYRHEVYPDDIQVCLSLPGYDPEVLWATAYVGEDGRWNAWLLDNPWNDAFGVKEQESVRIELRYVDKVGVSLPCAVL